MPIDRITYPGENTRFHPLDEYPTDSEGFPVHRVDEEAPEMRTATTQTSQSVRETIELTAIERQAIQAEVVALSPGAQPDESGSYPRDGDYEV
ncbi:hypothetical protein GW756_05705 [bacterium]|nr:hypothetical protein [bacterium]NCQ55915.1 hypothetical protein [Candidatus Parcubacteria bacterium]NCS67940.1 hypothetical protein [Candidatus Peregrinibacteria bacterium]NCS96834.1 hypothetical protein [bacterium]